MKVLFSKQAAKRLALIQPSLRAGIGERLAEIAADPFGPQRNVSALKGGTDLFRLRHGDWRVVYQVIRLDDILYVLVIETRGAAYR